MTSTCSHCLLPSLLLLLLLVAGCQQQAGAQTQPRPPRRSCSSSFTQRTCPNPPTVQGFDLKAYLGKWYEIGSTARFKLGTQSGLACVYANYTLKEQPVSRGVNITVVNTGLQVLGTVASGGIRQISEALGGACVASRDICSLVASDGPIQGILAQVKALSTSADLTRRDANALSSFVTQSANVLERLQGMTTSLASKVKQISLKTGDLSQALGSKALQLQQLKELVRRAEIDTARIPPVLDEIAGRRPNDLIDIANSLLTTSPKRFTGKAFQLTQAYGQISTQEAAIKLKIAEIRIRLNAVKKIADDVINKDNSSPLDEFSLTGFAEGKLGAEASKLDVFFPLPQGLTSGPYWVVAITGEASKGYEAALVYSCSYLPTGELDTGIFILSRRPTLSPKVVNTFLAKAEQFGHRFSCDNPFIFTLQSHPVCKI